MIRRLFGWLLGSGSAADTVRAAGDVADKLHTSDEERAAAQLAENVSARGFAAPGAHGTMLDVVIDGLNRLPRPVVTGYVLGGIAGGWSLPDLTKIDPLWVMAGGTIMGFWFGGRLITRDMPSAVLRVIEALRARKG